MSETTAAVRATPQTAMSRKAAPPRRARFVAALLPSAADMLFASVLLGGLVATQTRILGSDGDAAWNLRIGDQILRHGLPRSEFLLAPTYGRPIIYWEWLGQALYAGAFRFGGLNGVAALAVALVAATVVGLYRALRWRGAPLLLALAGAVAGLCLISAVWTARDQLFTLALTLGWSEWLWRYWRDGKRWRLWLFPPALALWANLHAGFLGGLLALAVAVVVAWLFPAGRGRAHPRPLALALLASLGATLLTPWGVGLPLHVIAFFRNPLIREDTQEYQSPNFHQFYGQLFLALLVALVAAWLWALWRRPALVAHQSPGAIARLAPEPLALALVAVWTTLALVSQRSIPLWGLIALPLIGDALLLCARVARAAPPSSAPDCEAGSPARSAPLTLARTALGGLVGALLVSTVRLSRRLAATDARVGHGRWAGLALLVALVTVARGGAPPGAATPLLDTRFDTRAYPVEAAQLLHSEGLPAGQGFSTFEWGGYLDEALPEYRGFIDSRSDVYGQALLRDYETIIGLAPGWRALWARYHLAWALLPSGVALAQALALTPGWRCAPLGTDGVATLCLTPPADPPAMP